MLKSELEVLLLYKKALEDLKLNIDLVKKMREDAATYKRRIQELESHVADQGAALSGQGKTIHGLREELRTFVCSRCEQREPEEELQEVGPRYVTWKQLAKAYEYSAAMKWDILEMATYLRSLASSPEEFDGCPYAECVCAALYPVPRKNCLSKMPEKQELKWRKKIME